MSIFDCKRIIVVGNGGSGKTVFATKLAEILDLPLVHLDREFWLPGWNETPRENWIEKHKRLITNESWIIDGNYGSTMKERFRVSDAVIFMDISVPHCYYNLIKRRIKYSSRERYDLPEDCPEFLRPDELRKVRVYPKTERNRVLSYMKRFPCSEMHTFYSLSAADEWLDELKSEKESKTENKIEG